MVFFPSRHCYERAIAVEKIINPVAPDTAGLNIDIGCLFMSKGDYRKSITYFEKAIAEYMRNRPPGYANSGVICSVLFFFFLVWIFARLSFMKEHLFVVGGTLNVYQRSWWALF